MRNKKPNPDEALWKQRFERLAQFMDDAKSDIKQGKMDIPGDRAWDACPEVFVSFAFDVVDDEDKAIELFGKGEYDVYKLARTGRDPYESMPPTPAPNKGDDNG